MIISKTALQFDTQENIDILEKLISTGYVSRQIHPNFELFIYNYTPKTQYENAWNEITLACRGLILDKNYQVVARPFPKFFNLEEIENKNLALPNEPFEVFDKLDGSLGILYWHENRPFIATRGSFTSDQAIYSNEKILPKYQIYLDNLDPNLTYLFEIIYPSNRIVLNYGEQEKLILLATINTQTGEEIEISSCLWPDKANLYHDLEDLTQIKKLDLQDSEGFVLRFKSGYRVKYKFSEYKRLHRLMTNVSSKDIWERLRDQENMENLLVKVPDEFYHWVKQTIQDLEDKYSKLLQTANRIIDEEKFQNKNRKEIAEIVLEKYLSISTIIFSILDHKDPRKLIFKLIKPNTEKPFTNDIDT